MFDFDRTPEQQRAELERWDGIERRKNLAFRAQVDRAFPKPAIAETGDLEAVYDYPKMDTEELIRRCRIEAALDRRHPQLIEPRYPFGTALLIAGAASMAFWTVIYLILSGGQ